MWKTARLVVTLSLVLGLGCGTQTSEPDSPSAASTTSALTSADAVPLYRYWNGKFHYYSTDPNVTAAGTREGITGSVYAVPTADSTALYRYVYNGGVGKCGGAHFYTTNFAELGNGTNGWVYEGITGYMPTSGAGTTSLYRYYNGGNCDHFYTADYRELGAGAQGWALEGVQSLIFGTAPSAPGVCTPGRAKSCCPYATGCGCNGTATCDASGNWGACLGASRRGLRCE